jgi:hypothetical protein
MTSKVKDYKIKSLGKYYCLYFFLYINSYEPDYVNSGTFLKGKDKVFRHYLALININIKFLFLEFLGENVHETLEITTVIMRGIKSRR